MRRIQKEFEDFMMTKTQGKIVEQLTVRSLEIVTMVTCTSLYR